jgi:hypothetical protein
VNNFALLLLQWWSLYEMANICRETTCKILVGSNLFGTPRAEL